MNNTLALKKITGLVNNEQNHVSENMNILFSPSVYFRFFFPYPPYILYNLYLPFFYCFCKFASR